MTMKQCSRRFFLRSGASLAAGAALFPSFVPSSALGKEKQVGANDRINVGCIGVGPQGNGVMGGFLGNKDAEVVAICDLKKWIREARKKRVESHYKKVGCKTYEDFRDLLIRDDIDAVLIATCDHWHVLTAIAAAEAGKDMYVEKPMGLSMAECRALRDAIHRYGRIFQFGTQQRSDAKFRVACEAARNERIGQLKTINVWSPGSSSGGSTEVVPPPEGLDYNKWLGQAPYKPHTKGRCTNRIWWFVSDYALGFIAGWGIHPIDIGAWGGGSLVDCPFEIEGTGSFPTEGVCDTATNWFITMKFQSGVTMNFAGNPRPEAWRKRYTSSTSHGTAFEGTEGWVHVHRGIINASADGIIKSKPGTHDLRLYESSHHVGNFLDCVRSRKKAVCDIDEAVRSETFCQVSDIAIRFGRKLKWDPAKERFIGDEQANRMLSRTMRSPWTL